MNTSRAIYARNHPRAIVKMYLDDAVRAGRVRIHPDARVDSDALFQDFRKWCEVNDWPLPWGHAFSAHLKGLGFPNGRGPTKVRGRRGLELVD